MKKSTLILPLAMVILASCGGGGASSQTSTPGSTSTSTTPTSTSTSTGGTSTSTSTGGTSTSTSTAPEVVPVVASIADVRTAAIAVASNAATANAYEVTGTVTALVGRSYHIQSGEDAIYVYHGSSVAAFPTGFEVGKKVKVTAYATNYNGMAQLAYVTGTKFPIQEEVLGDGDTIEPLVIDTMDLTNQALSSRLVKIENMAYVSGLMSDVTKSSRNQIIFKKGSTEFYCYIDKNLEKGQSFQERISGFTPNSETITYTGNLGYNSSYGGINIMPSDVSCFEN